MFPRHRAGQGSVHSLRSQKVESLGFLLPTKDFVLSRPVAPLSLAVAFH